MNRQTVTIYQTRKALRIVRGPIARPSLGAILEGYDPHAEIAEFATARVGKYRDMRAAQKSETDAAVLAALARMAESDDECAETERAARPVVRASRVVPMARQTSQEAIADPLAMLARRVDMALQRVSVTA